MLYTRFEYIAYFYKYIHFEGLRTCYKNISIMNKLITPNIWLLLNRMFLSLKTTCVSLEMDDVQTSIIRYANIPITNGPLNDPYLVIIDILLWQTLHCPNALYCMDSSSVNDVYEIILSSNIYIVYSSHSLKRASQDLYKCIRILTHVCYHCFSRPTAE